MTTSPGTAVTTTQAATPEPDALHKAPTGIEGFDDITSGGLPLRRTTLLMGGPGCGKILMTKIHHLAVADALISLKSGLAGLSDDEAQRRLAEFRKNEVEKVAHEALLITFAREFVPFFALILWIAAGA